MGDYRDWRTLREIDHAAGLPKGSAFRRFKQLQPTLHEGRDHLVLHHENDREAIDALRLAERIYPGSVNVLLFDPETAQQLVAALSSHPDNTR